MTGTAKTEEQEFISTYNLPVIQIPTNKPVIRKDLEDKLYKTEKAKFLAILNVIETIHSAGQPILVGTASIEKSEKNGTTTSRSCGWIKSSASMNATTSPVILSNPLFLAPEDPSCSIANTRIRSSHFIALSRIESDKSEEPSSTNTASQFRFFCNSKESNNL
jgi:hypothetical protein